MTEDYEDIELDPEDVILLLLEANQRVLGRKWLSGITRVEKLIFLLDNETDFEGVGRFFPFVAHNFGPFSKEVYEAVDFLAGYELIEVKEKSFSLYASSDEKRLAAEIADSDESESLVEAREREFALTDNGRTIARKLREAIKRRRPKDVDQLDKLVQQRAAWPLRQLIRYVYRRYPKMTEKSVHPEAQRLRQ